jgi:hypothetical protein
VKPLLWSTKGIIRIWRSEACVGQYHEQAAY